MASWYPQSTHTNVMLTTRSSQSMQDDLPATPHAGKVAADPQASATDTPALTSLCQGEDLGGAPRSPLDEAEEGEGEQGCCQACHQEPIGASSKSKAAKPDHCYAHAIGNGHAEVVQEGVALVTVWDRLQHTQQSRSDGKLRGATTQSSLTASGISCGGFTGGLEMPALEVGESCLAALRARMPGSV